MESEATARVNPDSPGGKLIDRFDPAARYTLYTPDSFWQGKTMPVIGPDAKGPLWLDVTGPPQDELRELSERFDIHPLTVEDIQVQDDREKCEMFERYLFVVVRTLDQVGPGIVDEWGRAIPQPVNIYLIIFSDSQTILTVHQPRLPHIGQVLSRLDRDRRFSVLTADWIAYTILDDVVDEFMPGMRTLELECDSIDDLVMVLSQSDRHEMLRRIGAARRRVTHLTRLLKPKKDIMKALTKRNATRLQPHTITYLRDIYDHVQLMTANLDHYGATLDRSHSNYIGLINIEMVDFSNRMTWVINKLSAAAVLAVPLSLITGMWGMNVPVPGQQGTTWRDLGPFFTIIGTMTLLMFVMFLVSRRFGWL